MDTISIILDTFWIRDHDFEYVLDTVAFGYVLDAFWIRFGYGILIRFEYVLDALWKPCEYVLETN